jgi:CRP-like cAMP-binding protein
MKPERLCAVPFARAFRMTNEETMAADSEDIFGRAIRKLDRLAHLDETDRQAIRALHARIETHPAHSVLVKDGARVTHCTLLIDGFVCGQKDTGDGGRQILSFHLPGDFVDLGHLLLSRSDHAVQTLTPATIARIAAQDLRLLAETRPHIGQALWRDTLIGAAITREWVVNVGRRGATARIAHLLCEFATRRQTAGFGPPERFDLPMTQEQIGDATGLTSVHVNRKLHDLQDIGVIARERRDLHIRDWPRLTRIGDFDPAYLHAAA